MATNFIITCPLDHLRGHYLNPMIYHGASIENTYFYQPPSTVNQPIGIYDHFRVSLISKSLLLIVTQAQYPLKVEIPCNIVAW